MNFVRRPSASVGIDQFDDCADPARVSRRPFQANAQTRSATDVVVEPGCVSILPDGQIKPPVVIIIAERRTAAFTVDFESALLAGDGTESAPPVAFEPQSATGIVTRRVRGNGEEILAHENVFAAIAVQIADDDSKNGRPLRFHRQGSGLEMVAAVQENHAVERGNDLDLHPREPLSQKVVHTRGAERGETVITYFDERKTPGQRLPISPWNDSLQVAVVISFDQVHDTVARSEERRVGKECRSRWS